MRQKSVHMIKKKPKSFNDYTINTAIHDLALDIEFLDRVTKENPTIFIFDSFDKGEYRLKVYNLTDKIELYKIMPILGNFGFLVVEESVFESVSIVRKESIWVHEFSILISAPVFKDFSVVKLKVAEAILQIYLGKAKNDLLNSLIVELAMSSREVLLVYTYCKYCLQIQLPYRQEFIRRTLTNHPQIARMFFDIFYFKFHPQNHDAKQVKHINKDAVKYLKGVTNSLEDKVIRKLLELVNNTLRTNYFQNKDYISIKLDSSKIEGLPSPKPFAEIYVYALAVEGVHLRSNKISRGGIRWSDRAEDYRTEVLGLMKAQMTKNAIIVPDGAKGGFFVKKRHQYKTQEEYLKGGIECYKIFLRGLLDITDNVISGKVVRPKDVVCHDGHDPYLVVAADKGTASFSDIANDLSSEYNFWLRDAFASGGSQGYDHKKIAITARGAWQSVLEHFSNANIDPNDSFTVTGIGDMAGDVFGNGLLLSDNMKLVAAFNHAHIFLDPNPDPKISFKERKRLFDMPRSSWSDYSKALLSKGGAIFERSVKSIELSAEVRAVLGIHISSMSPEELIRAILCAKVDLLWNGGIGTYVKAESESDDSVGDRSNDSLRVCGKDLKCAVVGEGGNLGFTQLGRIEYSLNGGLINTDFIDNSGGVSCSDHEVNIKIAFLDSKISLDERNALLKTMQDEVATLVLASNIAQSLNITLCTLEAKIKLDEYIKVIKLLEEKGGLSSKLESILPIKELQIRGYLVRPEMSVLNAYSKRVVYRDLLVSNITDSVYYEKFLLGYFPKEMTSKFERDILKHQLKHNIIASCLTNDIIDHTGIAFYILNVDNKATVDAFTNTYVAVWDGFELGDLWQEIGRDLRGNTRVESFTKVRNFTQKCILHLINQPIDILSMAEKIRSKFTISSGDLSARITGLDAFYKALAND